MPEIGYERLDPVVTYITECQFPAFQAVTDKTPIMSLCVNLPNSFRFASAAIVMSTSADEHVRGHPITHDKVRSRQRLQHKTSSGFIASHFDSTHARCRP